MNKFKDLIKTHIPETVCICVMIAVLVSMSTYAFYLHCQLKKTTKNPFEEVLSPALVIENEQVGENESAGNYEGNYYTVGEGSKYHLPDCSYVVKSDNAVMVSAEDLENGSLEPCKICIG